MSVQKLVDLDDQYPHHGLLHCLCVYVCIPFSGYLCDVEFVRVACFMTTHALPAIAGRMVAVVHRQTTTNQARGQNLRLDVVQEGTGWRVHPFLLEKKEKSYQGRGSNRAHLGSTAACACRKLRPCMRDWPVNTSTIVLACWASEVRTDRGQHVQTECCRRHCFVHTRNNINSIHTYMCTTIAVVRLSNTMHMVHARRRRDLASC